MPARSTGADARRKPPSVAITGGIGSGKSVIAAVFRKQGCPVISADLEARRLLAADPRIRRRITALLGAGAYRRNGTPDRKFIAGRIFSDPTARRRVEAVIHPAVIARIRLMLRAARGNPRIPLVAVEAALIFEAGMETLFDYVVVVDAPLGVRLRRIAERDGLTRAAALGRIRAQRSNDLKRARADVVIANSGDLRTLRAAAAFVGLLLAGAAGLPPRRR